MKTKLTLLLICSLFAAPALMAQSTAFTYQGRLSAGGSPANNLYEMQFTLFDALTNGSQVGLPVSIAPVSVSNGLFTVTLDFGAAALTGANRWLEITLNIFGTDMVPTTLHPRQSISPTPYAIHAANAAGLMSFANAPLDIKVNGERALRLEPTTIPNIGKGSGAPNVIGGSKDNYVQAGVNGATIGGGGASEWFDGGYVNVVLGHFGTVSGGLGNTVSGVSATVSGGYLNFSSGSEATVGGGENNTGSGFRATVSGGALNTASGSHSVVGGGQYNWATNEWSTIAGGRQNLTAGSYSAIGGGYSNSASNEASTVAGGFVNDAGNYYATVGGGTMNVVQGYGATIAGGGFNTIARGESSGGYSVIGGGVGNSTFGDNVTIAGGANNTSTGVGATISGGRYNGNDGFGATIAGGTLNRALNRYATVGGGANNRASGLGAFVGGGGGGEVDETYSDGAPNVASGDWSVVSGGAGNTAGHEASTIAGGANNITSGEYATVGGGSGNSSTEGHATVGGGGNNSSTGPASTVGGGEINTANGEFATVGGGQHNAANGGIATVGGGQYNTASNNATVGGGSFNTASGSGTTVGGGDENTASGDFATVGGGGGNTARGSYATVPGGFLNRATNYAFAAGHRAEANHVGAFVWADASGVETFHEPRFDSTVTNEFAVRATGGVRFVSAIDTNGSNIAGVTLASGSGTWSSLSDRNAKENFAAADGRKILDKVAALPLASWNYKAQDKSIRHLGPTAQDFRAAFGLGESDRTITTVDADGVALAAIQGLNAKLEEQLQAKDAELRGLKRQVDELREIVLSLAEQAGR